MGHGRGFFDFMRKEGARHQAGHRLSPVAKATDTVLSSASTGTPYKLPEEQAQMLAGLAHKECYRCKGSGQGKWKRHGTVVDVCICVQRRIPATLEVLEKQKAAIEADLAAARAEAEKTNEQAGEPQAVAGGAAGEEG